MVDKSVMDQGVGRRAVVVGLGALATSPLYGCAATPRPGSIRPGDAGWPSEADWQRLNQAVGGRLAPVVLPSLPPDAAQKLFANPIYLGEQAGLTQMSGWVDAWTSAPSAYVVRSSSAADVSAAVRFARERGVRLVVKGGGHSYTGGSNAPDSLLVWTRDMDWIELHDGFTPQACVGPPVSAVSVGAGCIWGRVYDEVTTRHGRYVQGGGCTTVGVAGLIQGGGFGSFSKGFGIAAASLLEAEIVTADGEIRIVNACQEPDLFWALKGGGGGTFGVVTRLTLKTHDLPQTFGSVNWSIKAKSDDAYRRLLGRFIDTFASNLFNAHWGEQARAMQDNRLIIQMMFQGLDEAEARGAWRELEVFVGSAPHDYEIADPLRANVIPPRNLWDKTFLSLAAPNAISSDDRPGARPRDFWWKGDGEQAAAMWHGYDSAWLPASLLAPVERATLADAWFAASRLWTVSFHFNKGMAGAETQTIAASRETSMNPQVLDAFALAIIASEGPSSYPVFPAPDLTEPRRRAGRIRASMQALRQAAPDAGSYLSECDYFMRDWGNSSWGAHLPKLERIKRQYDPDGLFAVHHGIGSGTT